jgi:hypothetical protein
MALGNAVVLFSRHPEQWAKMVDAPAPIASAVDGSCATGLRCNYGRATTVQTYLGGGTIPAGSRCCWIGAANRDERVFENPDEFAIGRQIPVALSLGIGIHAYLGAAFTRMELRLALGGIRQRWPQFWVDESGLRRARLQSIAGFAGVAFKTLP